MNLPLDKRQGVCYNEGIKENKEIIMRMRETKYWLTFEQLMPGQEIVCYKSEGRLIFPAYSFIKTIEDNTLILTRVFDKSSIIRLTLPSNTLFEVYLSEED